MKQKKTDTRKHTPAVRIELQTSEEVKQARAARVKDIERALTQCANEMERGKTRFVIICEPSIIYAVEKYLADAWGEYAPEVKHALIVTAKREPVKARKGGAR